MSVVRRTFEAANHPKGSPEWTRLQANALTSSYYPSKRYAVVDEDGRYVTSARTKAEAVAIDEVRVRLAAPLPAARVSPTSRRRLRFEIVVDVNPEKADAAEVLGRSSHPKRKPFVDGAWAMGTLVSLDAHDYDEWRRGEIACADAEELRGYTRAVINLVDPAHQAIDLLEPCPPRQHNGRDLTPAGRIEWYREHRDDERRANFARLTAAGFNPHKLSAAEYEAALDDLAEEEINP